MKFFIGLFLILSGVAAIRTMSHHQRFAGEVSSQETHSTAVTHAAVPVVVELFTSEGCSSCPPADELLSKLDQTQPIQGVEVIALGEHVDYWNKLGWIDPYSSAEFSGRQSRYADAFGQESVYTPQMIVDGHDEFVGGNANKANDAINKAAQSRKARVELLAVPDSSGTKLTVHVSSLPPLTTGDRAEVLLAVTENNLRSQVSRGENSGRYLRHSAVVRRIIILGDISQGQTSFDEQPTLSVSNDWQRDNLRAVAFVQERGSRRILGAASLRLSRN